MKRIFTYIQKKATNVVHITVLAAAIASCDSVLDYDDGDCSIKYRVKFKYDYNMKKVDAFAREVKTVTLYAFDDKGNFVYQKTGEGEMLADGSYSMAVDIDPKQYHLVTWAGLDDQSFAVPVMDSRSQIDDLVVLTLRETTARSGETGAEEEGKFIVKRQLSPLWHGEVMNGENRISTSPATGGTREEVTTIGLMKNTNHIRIIVAQVNQHPETEIPVSRAIRSDMFTYSIYDDNGKMHYDNSLLEDNLLTYEPFVTETSEVSSRAFSRSDEPATYSAAVAEFSVARLLHTQNPKLRIHHIDSDTELLPNGMLIRYLELLKEQNFIDMPIQEYLDREDSYGIIFFVNENLTLLKTAIQINDWVVNLNEFEL